MSEVELKSVVGKRGTKVKCLPLPEKIMQTIRICSIVETDG